MTVGDYRAGFIAGLLGAGMAVLSGEAVIRAGQVTMLYWMVLLRHDASRCPRYSPAGQ